MTTGKALERKPRAANPGRGALLCSRLNALMFVLLAISGLGVFAEEEDGHTVLYWKGGGDYWTGKSWAETSDGTTKKNWIDGSVAAFNSGNINFPQSGVCEVHKIRWSSSASLMSSGSGEIRLGAGGLELYSSMNCKWLAAQNGFRLMASQTWFGAASENRSINMNSASALASGDPICITAEDDVVLTLSGNLTWNFNVRTALTNADVVVGSPAKLAVTYYATQGTKFNARTLTLDGSASTLKSDGGSPCVMAKTLRLRNGGTLTVNSGLSVGVPLDGIAGKIVADAGTGTLAGVVAASSDGSAYLVEVAQNATLAFTCTWKGVPRLKLSGAGTVTFSGGGSVPEIEFANDFTGNVNLSCDVAFPVDYPNTLDISSVPVTIGSGASAVLRMRLPHAPVEYADGITLASGVTDPSATNGWAFAYWDSVSEAAFRAQDLRHVVSEGKVKAMPNDPPTALTCSSPQGWMDWSENWFVNDSTAETTGWIDGAIVTLQSGKNTDILSDVTIGGLRWTSFSSYFNASGKAVHLGSGGLAFTSSSGIRVSAMKELRLIAPQTWSGGAFGIVNIGEVEASLVQRYPEIFTANPDADLTLSGRISLRLNSPCDFSDSGVTLLGNDDAGPTSLYINSLRRGDRDVMLNAETLTLVGSSYVYDRSETRVAGGYAVAAKVVFRPTADDTPTIQFETGASGANPLFDIGAIEVATGGACALTGTAILPEFSIPVSIAQGSTLSVSCGFPNSAERPGAFILSGAGTFLCANAAQGSACTFSQASVSGFSGAVAVMDGGALNLSGAVDFPALELLGSATVPLKLDRGDRIADLSKVTFPASGTVTLLLYRDDAIAATEGSLDLCMDFSAVSAEDRAKIAIVVADGREGMPYSVTATPRFDGSGRLYADLAPSMSASNNSFGGMLWVGQDWADARAPANWIVYPQGTDKADFDPSAHPADTADAKSKMANLGIYCSSSWLLDLGGETWSSIDGRNNDASQASIAYGVSNGTLRVSQLMVTKGSFDVEHGGTFRMTGSTDGRKYWYIGSQNTKANPFVFRVHSGGAAEIGSVTLPVTTELYNLQYRVDGGGSLAYFVPNIAFRDKAKTTFTNSGELSFPHGFAVEDASSARTGAVEVVQNGGRLHLSGAFELVHGAGEGSTCVMTLAGGTTVISNGATFVGWDFRVPEGATFTLEIPRDGQFSTAEFGWGAGATLEKTGAGTLHFTVTDEVASVGIKLSEGVVIPSGVNNAASTDVVFAGGALGVDAATTGNDYGLLVTNGTVTGTCRVRNVGTDTGFVAPFLTVAASADPGYDAGDIVFEHRRGAPAYGNVIREEIVVEGVPCVRYSARFDLRGVRIIIR